MAITMAAAVEDCDENFHSFAFASRYVHCSLPKFKMPERFIPKEAVYQIIRDELMLDGNPRLNLASFVTTWMEPECDKLKMASMNKNYVDMNEYLVTTELQDMGVPLVAFSLRESSHFTVFDLSENLRRFGWIVPAYTMPVDAQHVAALRVVVRENFGRSLAERLLYDLCKVIREMEARLSRVYGTTVHLEMDANSVGDRAKKSVEQIQREVTTHWRRLVEGKKPGA